VIKRFKKKFLYYLKHEFNNLDLYDRNIEIKGGKIVKDVKKSE